MVENISKRRMERISIIKANFLDRAFQLSLRGLSSPPESRLTNGGCSSY